MTPLKLRILFITALLVLFAFWMAYRFRQKPQLVTRYLFITIDTLRADHMGAYGYSRRITPALDRLAADGVLFENAFCVMPTTLPSHGSIFFSTWPRIHGSTSNFIRFSNETLSFLPDLLQKAGYAVGAVVSVPHLGKNFQQYASFRDIRFPDRERNARETLDDARDWLVKNQNPQFFLWIHLWDPHSPYQLHPKFMEKIQPDFHDDFEKHYQFLKGHRYTPEQLQKMVDLYDNEIAYMDEHLGRFLDDFRKQDSDRTMIVVTSDHGESLGELVESEDYAFDHGEFLYDHQLQVPLIVLAPGLKNRSLRISRSVSLLDVMPTILEAAGIPLPSTVQGISLTDLFSGSRDLPPAPVVFLERREFTSPPMPFLAQRQFGIRESRYKLLYNEGERQGVLYENGQEGADLSDSQVRLKEMMMKRMQEWLAITATLSTGQGSVVSEEDAEKLKALGYVQ